MGNPARANRWRAGGLVLALLVALVSAFAASAPASGASPDAGRRVMPLGDSITDGFNVPGGYRVDLWRKLVEGGRTVDFVGSMSNGPSSLGDRDHEGHSGWTIAQLDANVPAWLRAHSPRTILLHIGTNDIYGPDPAGAPARLSALVDKITAQAPDAILLVATITPLTNYDAGVRAFNATIPDMVRSKANAGKKVHLVDMHRALTTADLADGVHPNAGGYGKMATAWHDALLAIPGSVDDDGGTTTTTTPPPTRLLHGHPPHGRLVAGRVPGRGDGDGGQRGAERLDGPLDAGAGPVDHPGVGRRAPGQRDERGGAQRRVERLPGRGRDHHVRLHRRRSGDHPGPVLHQPVTSTATAWAPGRW